MFAPLRGSRPGGLAPVRVGLSAPAGVVLLVCALALLLLSGGLLPPGRPRAALASALGQAHARWVDLQRAWVVATLPDGYRRLDEGAVTVYYPSGGEEESRAVARLAGRYLPQVAALLSAPAPRVTVVVVPSREAFGRALGWRYGLNAVGAYWRGVLWILAPSAWLDTAEPGWERRFAREGPVVHELAHLLLALQTGGKVPAWWDEGVAQHVEYRLTGFEWVVEGDGPEAGLYPLARLMEGFHALDDEALAYRQAALFVRFLAETRGERAIARVNGRLAAGWPLPEALRLEAGAPPEALERAWLAWLAERARGPEGFIPG